MTESDVERVKGLREKAARCRRIAGSITQGHDTASLLAMAEELEVIAALAALSAPTDADD